MSNKALFLDRDGVLNVRLVDDYVRTPEQLLLLDDILPALIAAKSRGYHLIVITNQQGVGKGLMSDADLDRVHHTLQELLRDRAGVDLDAIYVCTSLASAQDPRRKPSPGMLLEALQDFHLDPKLCWFLGDSETDVLAGRAAGVRTCLFDPAVAAGQHSTVADVAIDNLTQIMDVL